MTNLDVLVNGRGRRHLLSRRRPFQNGDLNLDLACASQRIQRQGLDGEFWRIETELQGTTRVQPGSMSLVGHHRQSFISRQKCGRIARRV